MVKELDIIPDFSAREVTFEPIPCFQYQNTLKDEIGKRLIKQKTLVRRVFCPYEKKKEKIRQADFRNEDNSTFFFGPILLPYQIIKYSLKVIVRRSDFQDINFIFNNQFRQKIKKFISIRSFQLKGVPLVSKMNIKHKV